MKPNFALNLLPDGIVLLHRAKEGWHNIGEVSLEDADWPEKLGFLRKTASALEKNGVCTKLIIPNSQILYTSVTAPGPSDAERKLQISEALDGLTPYAVEELVFDWNALDTKEDGQVHVAAVARETLEEAEEFAREHGFNPVSFVAIPPKDSFRSEPFFGNSTMAAELVGSDETLERDLVPVKIIPAASAALHALAPRDKEPAKLDTLLLVTQRIRAQNGTEAQTNPAAADGLAPEGLAAAPRDNSRPDEDVSEKEPATVDEPTDPDQGLETEPVPDDHSEKAPVPATDVAKPAEDQTSAHSGKLADKKEKTLQATDKETSATDPEKPDETAADSLSDDAAEKQAETVTFASRRKDSIQPLPGVSRLSHNRTARDGAGPSAGVLASVVPPLGLDRNESAPQESAPPHVSAAPVTQPSAPLQPPARQSGQPASPFVRASAPQVRNRQKLGLILTLLLAIVMVAAALWVTLFSGADQNAASQQSDMNLSQPGTPAIPDSQGHGETTATATPPAATTGSLQEAAQNSGDSIQETASPSAPVAGGEQTALATAGPVDSPAVTPAPDMQTELETEPEPTPPQPLTQQEAERQYAATGIWQKAPDSLPPPASETIDSTYIPSIDPDLPTLDAVALPTFPDVPADKPLPRQSSPAPPESRFTLDQRGLVIPSPEGTINPDGVPVIAGAPPRKPPARGNRVPQVAERSPDTRLAGIRPKPRPQDLIQTSEKANLGGRTRSELASLRPRPRPDSAQTSPAVNESPTAQAVASSRIPKHRPRNFAKLVAISRASMPSESETVTAAVSRRQTVAPRIPTRASVAKRATVANAINLHKVNLIGVYGSPSKRRALVRLPSGRYVKVKVGDRVDGGKVAAIGENTLRYIKGGRNITLKMPKT